MSENGRFEPGEKRVLLQRDGRLATVTINRPGKLNALSLALMDEFARVLDIIRGDDDISVVIVTGAGAYFSVGADLEFLHSLGSAEQFRESLETYWHRNFNAIENMEKVFIAALNGTAMGGAVEMALACDLRIAAESATFALPQINYGLIPDAGGTNRLARLVGVARAKELVFSGESIASAEASRIGLVNRVFPDAGFGLAARGYAEKFLDKSPAALRLGKRAINRGPDLDTLAGLDDAADLQTTLLNSAEYRQALRRFNEKHKRQ